MASIIQMAPGDTIASVARGATILLSCLAAGLAALGARRLQGTTLVAPAVWGCCAMLAIAAVEGLQLCLPQTDGARWMEVLHYAAAVSVINPAIAELGAKRPQNRGWRLVVGSLWIVLLAPAGHWLLSHTGDALLVAPAWGYFLAVLVVFPVAGYLPTRNWSSAVVWLLAQAAFLGGYVPPGTLLSGPGAWPVGAALACVAVALSHRRGRRWESRARGVDRAWVEFRDMFGAVWALRVLQRTNAEAEMHGWRWRLEWGGFVLAPRPTSAPAGSQDTPTERDEGDWRAIRDNQRSLLRRFVSNEWLDARTGKFSVVVADSP